MSAARPGRANVEVVDLNGRRIVELVDAEYGVGRHEVAWDGRDARGRGVAAGTYMVRLRVGESVEAERLIMLR